MKLRTFLLSASLLIFSPSLLTAQVILVDWTDAWDYMHPTSGVLPPDSGTTEPHPDGSTPWYAEQADFDASYTGPSFAASGARHEAGSGAGPLGYGTNDYMGTPLPPPGEFTAFGTTLTTPASGTRYSAYLRTTFTVPDDGGDYSNPVIRYILDDGGFIYLDGVLVLVVNMAAGATDDYQALAAGTANTESHIRDAELNLAPGSVTGGNADVAPAIAGNATVVEQIGALTPGIHTLAVAVHQAGNDSSDLTLALQLQAGVPNCTLSATISDVTRDPARTPNDPNDDTIDLVLNVVPTGDFGAGWEVIEPAGSAAVGQGGAYNTDVAVTDIPISEFSGGALFLVLADAGDPLCTTRVIISPPPAETTHTTLVDWNHTWNFMHPTSGSLPPGSGATTPHPAGSAPWFAPQAAFDAGYSGPSFTTPGPRHEAGSGPGPIGYGTNNYMGNPLPPPAEFTTFGTSLTTPPSGSRYTAYFRTTFTVPSDGSYINPIIRYILDDGGFVYIDGVLVLEVNVPGGAADDYLLAASGTANTESHIRQAELNLAPGSLTGGNDEVTPAIAGNATVVEQIGELAPGLHTLAIAVHQQATTSSDVTLAVQLRLAKVPGRVKPFFDVVADGNNLVFNWESRDGQLFNLRSETGLANPPLEWPIFGGQADLAATPPLNTLTIPRPADAERYFVVESFPAPPSSLFSDDFESGPGEWTVGSDGADGTAWTLGTPTVGPPAANSPVNCFGTNLTSNYDFSANVWLRSPPLDLTTASGATLSYFQFVDIELQFDFGTLSILDAADNSVLAVIEDGIDGESFDWEKVTKSIPTAALGKVVKLEFRFQSDEILGFTGWYIDDVLVTVP